MIDTTSGRQDHMTDTGPRLRRPLLAGAGVLFAAGLLAAPAQAAFPGKNGRVVYEKQPNRELLSAAAAYDAQDGTELWTSDAKGGDLKLLVSFADRSYPLASAHDPAVSADGKRVAYVESGLVDRSDPTYEQIRIVGIDGSGDHALRDDIDAGSAPAWSPDGTKIVYVQDGDAQVDATTLVVAAANGSGTSQPIEITGLGSDARNPQWSPDGKWIAFDSAGRVYVVPAGGGKPVGVGDRTDEDEYLADAYPNWAPDGSAIIFQRYDGGMARAARADTDYGSQLIEVPFEHGKPTNASEARVAGADGWPERAVYSPDGLGLLYTGTRYDPAAPGERTFKGVSVGRGLILSGADGSNPSQFVATTWQNQLIAADWAPIPTAKPAPKPPTPVVTVTPKPGGGVKGITEHRCGSRRNFVIRLRPRGAKIVMARVLVNGKRVKSKKGKRWTAHVDLRTLPKKRFKVDVTVWTKDGRRYHEVRRYWTCTPAR